MCAFTLKENKSKGLQTKAVVHQTLCAQVGEFVHGTRPPINFVLQIPEELTLEAAVTITDNFVTAFYTLFNELGLPIPKTFPATYAPPDADKPILIYGAGATTGQYAIQLLKLAGYTNIIATASTHNHEYLRSLGARHTIDYKSPDMVEQVIRAADGKVGLVMDCISAEGTLKRVAQVVQSNAKVALLLPVKEGDSVMTESGTAWMSLPPERNPFEASVEVIGVMTFLYQQVSTGRSSALSFA